MDINKAFIRIGGSIYPIFSLYKISPNFELEKSIYIVQDSKAMELFKSESIAYAQSRTHFAFYNNELSSSWSKQIGDTIDSYIDACAYNKFYDSIIVVQYRPKTGYDNIISFDRLTGNLNWKADAYFPVGCSIDNKGDIYVGCSAGTGNAMGGLKKYNGLTGDLLWQKDTNKRWPMCDAGIIGGVNGVIAVKDSGGQSPLVDHRFDGYNNVFMYNENGSLIWETYVPSYEANIYGGDNVLYCRIFGNSQDILISGHRQEHLGSGAKKSLWRLNGGNGGLIWDLDLGDKAICIDYDDSYNIWCGVLRNNLLGDYFNLAKISSSGNILSLYDLNPDGIGGSVIPHFRIQVAIENEIVTTTEEPVTTTLEPLPCEVSNLFEYGYVEKDGIKILVRKTTGNQLRLIRPIPPEWTVGSTLKLVPGCNKTLCDCLYKWNNVSNFCGIGIKMLSNNPLVDDRGANPS